jgi:hypothetical protein
MGETRNYDGLKYVGDGTCIPGIPARDLTAEEVSAAAPMLSRLALLTSGLYREHETKKAYTPKPTKAAFKGGVQAEDNKE